jgi:hypothetical protein
MGQKRTRGGLTRGSAILATLVTAALFLALTGGTALAADRWTDITDLEWIQTYHVTSTEAATVADGYPDGTFLPDLAVTRGQFAKMLVDGLSLGAAQPAAPTFTDVQPAHPFYPWIEGGVAAGVMSGYPDSTFRPDNDVTRQQANSFLGIYLAGKEIAATGKLHGAGGDYTSLAKWFNAEGPLYLTSYSDRADVAAVHAPGTAYLVFRGIVLGSSENTKSYLNPLSGLSRAQAVALILRTKTSAGIIAFPTVTGVAPTEGPAAGGNSVVISGTGFLGLPGGSAVKFGTVNAASYVVNSPLMITAVAPAGTAGSSVDITVTTPSGTSAVFVAGSYTYLPPPVITKIAPSAGLAGGGTAVAITGSGFSGLSGASAVRFGTANATSYVVVSATQITAVAPAGTAGSTVSVSVSTAGGTSVNTSADDYSYGPPTVTGLDPGAGPVVGGNQVVIMGTGFTGLTGASAVKFGASNAATYTVDSPTQITALAPLGVGGGSVDVRVTNPAGTSANTLNDNYSYGPPAVTGLDPGAGRTTGGNKVIIKGTGFSGLTGSSAVKFGTVNATSYVINSATQITAVAPAGTARSTVNVSVTSAAGKSTNTLADDYSYGPPTIEEVDPEWGPAAGGNTVVITGTGFSGLTEDSAVMFGTEEAESYSVDSPTQITAVAPEGDSGDTVDIRVTTPAGTSAIVDDDEYTYVGGPVIRDLDPASGPAEGGNEVVITGFGFTNLVGASAVKFGSVNALAYIVESSTQVLAFAPAGTVGTKVSVSVTNSLGTSPNTTADDYTYTAQPTVSDITPDHGTHDGGTKVIITGTRFTGLIGASAVRFGGKNATSYQVDSSTQITAVAPSGVAGSTVDVTVRNPAGTSVDTAADDYRYTF